VVILRVKTVCVFSICFFSEREKIFQKTHNFFYLCVYLKVVRQRGDSAVEIEKILDYLLKENYIFAT